MYFGKSLVSTAFFASNLYFHRTAGYFAGVPHQNTLLHTWSLAVEEQFYILFPIVIYFVHKYHVTKIKIYVVIGIVLSLGCCIIFSKNNAQFSFYMLPIRVWEFLMGTLLTFRFFSRLLNPKIYHSLSIIGFVFIIVSIFLLNAATPYPGHYALFPVFGAFLIIYSGKNYPKAFVNNFLSLPIFVLIGKISYSLYLWHWVMYVFYRHFSYIFNNDKPLLGNNGFDIMLLIIISFLLSYLTWRFIEQPFRYPKKTTNKTYTFKIAFVTSSLAVLVGVLLYKTNGLPQRFDENKILINSQKDSVWNYLSIHNDKTKSQLDTITTPIVLGNPSKSPHFIIWGDSHAMALGGGLNTMAIQQNSSFYLVGIPTTIALQNIDLRTISFKNNAYPMSLISKKVLEFIIKHPKIKTVAIVGRYNAYLNNTRGLSQNIKIQLLPTNNKWDKYKENNALLFEKGLRETLHILNKNKRKIILVTDVPELNQNIGNLILRKKYTGKKINDLTPNRIQYEFESKTITAIFIKLKSEGLVHEILPLHEAFFEGNKTILEENNHLLYRDDDHLSYYGAIKASSLFTKYFNNNK